MRQPVREPDGWWRVTIFYRNGRREDVDIRVDDPGVSRQHCEIVLGSPALLRDLNDSELWIERYKTPTWAEKETLIPAAQIERVAKLIPQIPVGMTIDKSLDQVKELKQLAPVSTAMVGRSAVMNQLRQMIEKAAPTNSRILIRGPSGSGKELAARHLHSLSGRASVSMRT